MTSTEQERPGGLKLTEKQYDWLLHEINPNRVRELRGNSHLEAWDVRRTLTQVFGFGGWEVRTKQLRCVREIETPPDRQGGRSRWTVVYTAEVALTVHGLDGTSVTYEDGATGDGVNQPSLGDAHDQALKTSLSQALKRCAVNLGDQFGLSLYNGGKVTAVVRGTFVPPNSAAREDVTPPPADEHPVEGERPVDDDERDRIADAGTPIGRGERDETRERQQVPARGRAERVKAKPGAPAEQQPAAQEDPWATVLLDADGAHALAGALACGTAGDLRPLRQDVRAKAALATQSVTPDHLNNLAAGSAAVLNVGGPLPLLEVVDRIGKHLAGGGARLEPVTKVGAGNVVGSEGEQA